MEHCPSRETDKPRFNDLLAQRRYLLTMALVGLVYIFAEIRYPVLNYDDTYLLGHVFPALKSEPWSVRLHALMFDLFTSTNEFRTYGLVKIVHYFMYRCFGTALAPYFLVMALMSCLAAALAARTTLLLTHSQSMALAVFCVFLLNPFTLFQTFHHATYTLLPLLLMTGYALLLATGTSGFRRTLVGGALCLSVVLTGEVVALVLATAIVAMMTSAMATGQRKALQAFAIELLVIVVAVGLLYLHYRLAIFKPELSERFQPGSAISLSGLLNSLAGFEDVILNYATGRQYKELLSLGGVLDTKVAVALVSAGLATCCVFATAPDEPAPRKRIFKLATLIALLYIVSSAPYILLAAKANVSNFPPRYLHVSGILALTLCVLACGIAPPILRKVLSVAIVALSTGAAVLTFAIKVPTLEASHADLKARILAAKGTGHVDFDSPVGTQGYMNPYLLEPATSPYTGYWILENFCPMVLQVTCVRGKGESGDVVVTPEQYREGYLTQSRVEVKP